MYLTGMPSMSNTKEAEWSGRLRSLRLGAIPWNRPIPVEQVPQSEKGMAPEDLRDGIPHNRLHLLTLVGKVAVDRAFGASGLTALKAAAFQADVGVVQQGAALRAQIVCPAVLAPAVNAQHCQDGPVLSFESLAREHRAGCGPLPTSAASFRRCQSIRSSSVHFERQFTGETVGQL